ncbi:Dabb family protein [Methylohalobius crimeensis]|uniref:Dabb family protein n=1 Tax=Methylohalobius crimeensis TaxID=244365 RepID=UPI0003B46191|nr:Dabb family protein [Methylohalobius crimeensis]
MMRRFMLVLLCLSIGWWGTAWSGSLAKSGQLKHVVIVWLKQPDQVGRFMALSKRLVDLPGVVDYSVGPARPGEEHADGEPFQVGVVVTLENRQALYDYMRHPKHLEVIEAMQPLVDRITVYDFITR